MIAIGEWRQRGGPARKPLVVLLCLSSSALQIFPK